MKQHTPQNDVFEKIAKNQFRYKAIPKISFYRFSPKGHFKVYSACQLLCLKMNEGAIAITMMVHDNILHGPLNRSFQCGGESG